MARSNDRGAASGGAPLDPELEADLGPELDLRGDRMEDELQAARTEMERMRSECDEARDRAARIQADLENTRRRLERDHETAVQRAGERIVTELLPVLDNLERAIEHTTAGGDLRELLKGVELVQKQILEVLQREGVGMIDPFGEAFDPYREQAVQQREDPDVPDHTVVEVFQKGYEMRGRVIRHAMVAVSTGGPERKE